MRPRQQGLCLDRRQRRVLDAAGVVEKFGVPPASFRTGSRSSAIVQTVIRARPMGRQVSVGDTGPLWPHRSDPGSRVGVASQGAGRCGPAASLREHRDEAYLYRRLATCEWTSRLPKNSTIFAGAEPDERN